MPSTWLLSALLASALACNIQRNSRCAQNEVQITDWSRFQPKCAQKDMVQLMVTESAFPPAGFFANYSSLDSLCLDRNNHVSSLPSGFLGGLTALTSLRMKDNVLSSIPADLFATLSNLKTIDFSGNRLETVPSDLFQATPNLQIIKMDGNVLKTLPLGLLRGLSRLQELDIDRNRLNSLPYGFFSSLPRLTTLSLDCPPECTLRCLIDGQRMPSDCARVSEQMPLRFYHVDRTGESAAPTLAPTPVPATQSPTGSPTNIPTTQFPTPAVWVPSNTSDSLAPSSPPTTKGEVVLPPNVSSLVVSLKDSSVGVPAGLFQIFNNTRLVVTQDSTELFKKPEYGQDVGRVVISITITDKETGASASALPVPINFTLPRSGDECSPTCGWYQLGSSSWESGGCTAEILDSSTLLCTCHHLTDFAMLFEGLVCDPEPRSWFFALVVCYALILLYSIYIWIRQACLRAPCGIVTVQHFLICGVAVVRILSLLRYLHVFRAGDVVKAILTAGPYIFQDLVLSILIESWRQAIVNTTGHIKVGVPLIAFNVVFFVLVALLAVGLASWGSASAWALGGTLALGLLLVVFMVAFGVGGRLMKSHLTKSAIKASTQVSSSQMGLRFQRVGTILSLLFAVELVSSVCALVWVGNPIVLLSLTTVYLAADVVVWGVVLLGYWDAVHKKKEKSQSRSAKSLEASLASKREREQSIARRKISNQRPHPEERRSLMELSSMPRVVEDSSSVTITSAMSPLRMVVSEAEPFSSPGGSFPPAPSVTQILSPSTSKLSPVRVSMAPIELEPQTSGVFPETPEPRKPTKPPRPSISPRPPPRRPDGSSIESRDQSLPPAT